MINTNKYSRIITTMHSVKLTLLLSNGYDCTNRITVILRVTLTSILFSVIPVRCSRCFIAETVCRRPLRTDSVPFYTDEFETEMNYYHSIPDDVPQ